jgi:hypothetical protein
MGGAATPCEAATPGRTVRGPAGVRGRGAKPHDYEDDRISNGGRNETRALTLMPTLRVNSGTERVIDGASRVLFLPLGKCGMTR